MTKQAFEEQIIDLIDETTGVSTEVTDEGTIGVGVTFDEDRVREATSILYDELTTTTAPAEPADTEPKPTTGSAGLFLELDLGRADAQLPARSMVTASLATDGPTRGNLIVDVEAWQHGEKVNQAFATGIVISKGTGAEVDLTLPTLEAGTYQLKAFIFEGPKDGSYEWGPKLYSNEDVGTFTVEAAPKYHSDAPVTAGYARLRQQVDEYVTTYPELKAIADQPTGVWLGMEWTPDPVARGREIAAQAGDLPPLIVVYSIPNRDTGEYSQGGAKSPAAYMAWIDALAKGVGDHPAINILEPDALGHLDKMSKDQTRVRLDSLAYAAKALRAQGAQVYIDASMWVDPAEMTTRIRALTEHRLAVLDGFSINVSNYKKLSVCKEYGDALSKLTGLDYLIDTSRNGIGTDLGDGRWCNVPGQAIGERPDLSKGFIWAKCPGESDGPENGGPNAGEFWVEGALALVRNAQS